MQERRLINSSENRTFSFFEKAYFLLVFLLSTYAIIPLHQLESGGEYDISKGDTLMQSIWIVCYIVTIILVFKNWNDLKKTLFENKLLWILFGFSFLSIFWSDTIFFTGRRVFALFFTQVIAFYFASKYNLKDFLKLLNLGFKVTVVLCFLLVIFIPDYGIHHGFRFEGVWRGVYAHKNTLGRAMAIGIMVFIFTLIDNKRLFKKALKIDILFLLLAFILLIKSGSKTALFLVMFFTLIIVVVNISRKSNILTGFLVFFITAISLGGFYFGFSYFEDILGYFGKDYTLTGRLGIWKLVIEAISYRPTLGYGFASFWFGFDGHSAPICNELELFLSQAHNGYLNVVLELGIVGFSILMLIFIISIVKAFTIINKGKSIVVIFPLVFFLAILFYNTTESFFIIQNSISWILICTFSCMVNEIKEKNLN